MIDVDAYRLHLAFEGAFPSLLLAGRFEDLLPVLVPDDDMQLGDGIAVPR